MRLLLRKIYVPVKIDPETGEMWRDPVTGFAQRTKYSEGGEIIIKMSAKTDWPGYYKSEAATSKKIAYNVFEKGDIYYRPGDALRRDEDGLWYFMDRLGMFLVSLHWDLHCY
jgi:acyl-coenzyme A synthetase/AMP-(fatty) acid ligase